MSFLVRSQSGQQVNWFGSIGNYFSGGISDSSGQQNFEVSDFGGIIEVGYDNRFLNISDTSVEQSPFYVRSTASIQLYNLPLNVNVKYHPFTELKNDFNTFSVGYSKKGLSFDNRIAEIKKPDVDGVIENIEVDTFYTSKLEELELKDRIIEKCKQKIKYFIERKSTEYKSEIGDSINFYKSKIHRLQSEIDKIKKQYGSILESYQKILDKKKSLSKNINSEVVDIPQYDSTELIQKSKGQFFQFTKSFLEYFDIGGFRARNTRYAQIKSQVNGVNIGLGNDDYGVGGYYGKTVPLYALDLSNEAVLPSYRVFGGSIKRKNSTIEIMRIKGTNENPLNNSIVSTSFSYDYEKIELNLNGGYSIFNEAIQELSPGDYDNLNTDSKDKYAFDISSNGSLWKNRLKYQAKFERIGDNFVNLADPFLLRGSEQIFGNLSAGILKNSMRVGLKLDRQELFGNTLRTNNGVEIALTYNNLPSLTAAYYPYSLNRSAGIHNYEIHLSHAWKIKESQIKLSASNVSNDMIINNLMADPEKFQTKFIRTTISTLIRESFSLNCNGTYFYSFNGSQNKFYETDLTVGLNWEKLSFRAGTTMINQIDDSSPKFGGYASIEGVLFNQVILTGEYRNVARNDFYQNNLNEYSYASVSIASKF